MQDKEKHPYVKRQKRDVRFNKIITYQKVKFDPVNVRLAPISPSNSENGQENTNIWILHITTKRKEHTPQSWNQQLPQALLL